MRDRTARPFGSHWAISTVRGAPRHKLLFKVPPSHFLHTKMMTKNTPRWIFKFLYFRQDLGLTRLFSTFHIRFTLPSGPTNYRLSTWSLSRIRFICLPVSVVPAIGRSACTEVSVLWQTASLPATPHGLLGVAPLYWTFCFFIIKGLQDKKKRLTFYSIAGNPYRRPLSAARLNRPFRSVDIVLEAPSDSRDNGVKLWKAYHRRAPRFPKLSYRQTVLNTYGCQWLSRSFGQTRVNH